MDEWPLSGFPSVRWDLARTHIRLCLVFDFCLLPQRRRMT